MEDNGYKVDKRLKKSIPEVILLRAKNRDEITEDAYFNYFSEPVFSLCFPCFRLFEVYENIKYLLGDYTSNMNLIYAKLEDLCLKDNYLQILTKKGLIVVDNEMQQVLKDRKDALESLENNYKDNSIEVLMKKYDNKEKEENIVFSEKDTLNELHDKLEKLQKLIEKKESKINNQQVSDEVKLTLNNRKK